MSLPEARSHCCSAAECLHEPVSSRPPRTLSASPHTYGPNTERTARSMRRSHTLTDRSQPPLTSTCSAHAPKAHTQPHNRACPVHAAQHTHALPPPLETGRAAGGHAAARLPHTHLGLVGHPGDRVDAVAVARGGDVVPVLQAAGQAPRRLVVHPHRRVGARCGQRRAVRGAQVRARELVALLTALRQQLARARVHGKHRVRLRWRTGWQRPLGVKLDDGARALLRGWLAQPRAFSAPA